MRNILLSLFFLSGINFFCYAQHQTWEKYYGTSKTEEPADLIVTSDNSYLMVSAAGQSLYDRSNIYVVKTDTSGNVKWSKILNYGMNNYTTVIESSDHYYYISSTGLIVKMAEDGTVIWKRTYTNTSEKLAFNLAFDANGDLLGVGGKSVITYSKATGDVISTHTFDKGNFSFIKKNSNGGYIIGGSASKSTNYNPVEAYFMGLNANLDSLWGQQILCDMSNIRITQILEQNGQYLIAGNGCYSYQGNTNCWYNNSSFFAIDLDGTVREKFWTGAGYSFFTSFAVKDDGSLIGFGSYGSSYPVPLSFFTIDTVNNQLQYPPATMRNDIGIGRKIIALGNNRFLALASTVISGHGSLDLVLMKFGADLVTNTLTVNGMVYLDAAKNCNIVPANFLKDEIVVAYSPAMGYVYTKTDAYGKYTFRLPADDYHITHVPSRYKYVNCPVNGYNVTLSPSTPVENGRNFLDTTYLPASAPFLKVDISANTRIRPCLRSTYAITYCNQGTQVANNVNVVLTLDPSISIISSTQAYTKTNNEYTFSLGNLAAKSTGSINIVDSLACINTLTGQTKCAQARISYDTLYALPFISWDKSSIEVTGWCDGNDSVRFMIKNVGQPMTTASQYRLYESDGLRQNNFFQLQANESIIISVYANGATYRLEADQVSGYPSFSMPSVVIEACGRGIATFPSGYVNTRSSDDERYTYDEVCALVVNSFDPNEKSAVPKGITQDHFIKDNTRLKYHVDFQNTGTDVAYTVVIYDTLSSFLDPATIVMGASSHPYEWEISAGGALIFTFNNINLPDSTSDEVNSHGYITFEVSQKNGNAQGTVIKNKAAIVFDYNTPVITNEVFHTINNTANPPIPNPPLQVITSVFSVRDNMVSVYPNPVHETAIFELSSAYNGNFSVMIKDMSGREVYRKESISGNVYQLSAHELNNGIYIYVVYDDKGEIAKGKIIVID